MTTSIPEGTRPLGAWTKFPHDCDSCIYLGSGSVNAEQVDWYVCPESPKGKGSLGGSIIGRYGPDGPEYWSSPVSMINADSLGSFSQVAFVLRKPALKALRGAK